MIITEQSKSTRSTLTGERSEFKIATNAKAFRVLVDGIYADKIGSIVRELLSNSWDAHVRNGNTAERFEVRLPNPLNPTFSVRDYGCSMPHEFVMNSYSTLFESSKSDSNDEVGAFGLGAKSFLAYTDACMLTCWLDGEVRRYDIRLADSGVPEVRLVHRAPSGERQGVEVTFAVAQGDFADFRRAAQLCAYGFDTLPRFLGDEVEPVQPDFSGEGWRFWRHAPTEIRSHIVVRQGCAVYPAHVGYFALPSHSMMIVDTPIGSANVTASRESLALTSEQREEMARRVEAAITALNGKVQEVYAALPTDVQRAHFAEANKSLLGSGDFPTSVRVPVALHKWDAGALTPYQSFASSSLHRVLLVHDNGTPIPRRQMRLRAAAKVKAVYVEQSRRVLEDALRFLELDPSQLISIDALPDVKVNRTKGNGSGAKPEKKVIESDAVWATCNRNACEAGQLRWHRTKQTIGTALGLSSSASEWIGNLVRSTGKPMLFLTDAETRKALAEGRIDANRRIDRVIIDALKATPNVKQRLDEYTMSRALNGAAGVGYAARRILLESLGLSDHAAFTEFPLIAAMLPEMVKDSETRVRPVLADLRRRYPLLFAGNDAAKIVEYIAQCDALLVTDPAPTSQVA